MLRSRREWSRWCAAALLGTGIADALTQTTRRSAAQPVHSSVVLALSERSAFANLPLTIAERLRFFAAEGVSVEIKEFPDDDTAMAAVLSGSAQLYAGSFASIVVQRAQGAYLSSFVVQGLAPQIGFGISQRTLKGSRTARDLKGRRIGITKLGSDSHRVALQALEHASVPAREVRFMTLPNSDDALGAFLLGDLDAIAYPDPLITRLEQSGELRLLVDTRTLRGSDELFGGPWPAYCLAASAAWMASNPVPCQALADAMVHALKWLRTAGPSDVTKAVPEPYFGGDRALYLAAFERTRASWAPDGLMPADGPLTVAKWLERFDQNALKPLGNLSSSYTNQFALKAKERFRA